MTKTTRRQLRTIRRRRLALALAGVLAVPAVPAVAQNMPEAGSVVSGSATINNAGFELIINQASQGAIIDWGSFSIGAGYGVTFNQPNASAVILNRVVGLLGPGYAPSISNINGSLSANGNVFILNPSGVVFGNNGTSDQINVGGLIASTLWMNQGNFESSVANGTPWILFDNGVSTTGYVRNNGSIVAGAGGVGLVSPLVWNRGSITSNGGNILAGAGGQVTLDYDGDGLTQVTINVASTRDGLIVQDRFGTMTADGGLVALRTAATAAGTGGVIYASGTIRAQTLSNVNGRVELTSNGGLVMLGAPGTFSDVTSSPFTEGHIDVSGGSNQTGGSVLVQGNSVLLVNNDATPFSPTNPLSVGSSIDASGGGSGGQVLIQSATSVLGLALSSIDARGVANGDGGTIDILAFGGSALLLGTTTADAGKASGNGGRIRIGATANVAVGQASASAAAGNGGQIQLIGQGGAVVADALDTSGLLDGGTVSASSATGIQLGTVDARGFTGDGGSLLATSGGRIVVTGDIDARGGVNGGSIALAGDATATPTYAAIEFNGRLDASGGTGSGGTVGLSATSGDITATGTVAANGGVDGGVVSILAPGNVSVSHLYARGDTGIGGSVTVTGTDVRVGYVYVIGGAQGGDITLTASGDLYVDGSLYAMGTSGDGGSIVVNGDSIGLGYVDVDGGANGGTITLAGGAGGVDVRGLYADGGAADGGTISVTSVGDFYSAAVEASGGINGGSITISGDAEVYVEGDVVARGTTGLGGQIALDGYYVGFLGADASGGTLGGDITLDAGLGGVRIGDAYVNGGLGGDGGTIGITSTGDTQTGALGANGGVDGGSITVSGEYVDIGAAWASGTSGQGGTVAIDAYSLVVYGNGGWTITADGGTGGGSISLTADRDIAIGEYAGVSANATGSGTGGDISISALQSLIAYGRLQATGIDGGGSVWTGSSGGIDLSGVEVNAGSSAGPAGSWTVSAPSLDIIAGAAQGSLPSSTAPVPITTQDIQDADLNYAFGAGTDIVLESTTGAIAFTGAQIVVGPAGTHAFTVNSQSAITGDDFSINAIDGLVDIAFNSDANGSRPEDSGISFNNASLHSNGGDILFYGQSDAAAGMASSSDSGIRLVGSDIDTAGGHLSLRGFSDGVAGSPVMAGVVLDGTTLQSGAGALSIYGNGLGAASGVIASNGSIGSGIGGIAIDGFAVDSGDGIAMDGTGIASNGGEIVIDGTGGGAGVVLDGYGNLYSNGGGIQVTGDGGTGDGVRVSGAIASGGADITMYGTSTDARGLVIDTGFFRDVTSGGGAITLTGQGASGGVAIVGSGYGSNTLDSGGGLVTVVGTAGATDGVGVLLYGIQISSGAGDTRLRGDAANGTGIQFGYGSGITTTTGAIDLYGAGAAFGLDLSAGTLQTDSGDLTLEGHALGSGAIAGVRVLGNGLVTNGGDITVRGTSAAGAGVELGDDGGPFALASGGGAILLEGAGVDAGVRLQNNQVDSGGGGITVTGSASGAGGVGVDFANAQLAAGAGDVSVLGTASAGTGLHFGGTSDVGTTSGDIRVTGIGQDTGFWLEQGQVRSDSGHIDLRGRGMGTASDGLVIGAGVSLVTDGGGIDLSGEGGSGAGLVIGAGALVDAGNSLVVLRAGNDGSSDAIQVLGAVHSTLGVNLRPGGVDATGALTDRLGDEILLGGGTGFALDSAELALIDAPQLVIGSAQHAGAIRVTGATARDGNLTLQNAAGGIDLQANLDVGSGTLALLTGGTISQAAAGAITAHSLLANAGGSVQLGAAQNDVASTTLAGTSGGDFQYQDANALAIGAVSASGFDAATGQLTTAGATGITAGGNVLVRNLAGNLTLDAGVTGNNIDLVTAGLLMNPAAAALTASGNWRVWASTWVGEDRGGLAGSGALPNLYNCAYLGPCGVTVPGTDNHFIYVAQPTAVITIDNATREYGLANPVFTYTLAGAILGDSAAAVATGTPLTSATIGSNVGNYAITGGLASAAGYNLQYVGGTLAITPATLLFTADALIRYLGMPNPQLTGDITGFRNGDTVESVFGGPDVWSSPAGLLSPVGYYPVFGGTSAINYVFAQAPGNAIALHVIPLPQLPDTPVQFVRDTVNTYVYDLNLAAAPVCALDASLEDQQLASTGDPLSTEWTKVRSRPNLTNCFDSERENGCGGF